MRVEDIKPLESCYFNCKFWHTTANRKKVLAKDCHGTCCWAQRCFLNVPDWIKETTRFTMGHHGNNCNAFSPVNVRNLGDVDDE